MTLPKCMVADGEITGSHIEATFKIDPATGDVFYLKPKYAPQREAGLPRKVVTKSRQGYINAYISRSPLKGKYESAHRLVWLWVNGEWPQRDLDHINGVPDDNRIDNLRLATESQNMANRKTNKNSKSGYKWVHWDQSSKKWRYLMAWKGKRYSARFDTAEEAYAEACRVAKRLHQDFYNPGA